MFFSLVGELGELPNCRPGTMRISTRIFGSALALRGTHPHQEEEPSVIIDSKMVFLVHLKTVCSATITEKNDCHDLSFSGLLQSLEC